MYQQLFISAVFGHALTVSDSLSNLSPQSTRKSSDYTCSKMKIENLFVFGRKGTKIFTSSYESMIPCTKQRTLRGAFFKMYGKTVPESLTVAKDHSFAQK